MRPIALLLASCLGGSSMAASPIDSLQPFGVPLGGREVSAIVAVVSEPMPATVLIVPDASGRLVVYTITPMGLTPPTPVPPQPVPPAPLPALSRDVRDWSLALVPATSRGGAKALAGAYRSTAAKIRAGDLKSLADVQAAQTTANRAALGLTPETANSSPWKPLIVKVAGYLTAAGYSDPAAAAAPLASVWDEIATGLEAVQ